MRVTIKINDLETEKITNLTEDIAEIVKKYEASYFKIEADEEE